MRSWIIAFALVMNLIQAAFAVFFCGQMFQQGAWTHVLAFSPVWATPPVSILALSVAWWGLRQSPPLADQSEPGIDPTRIVRRFLRGP